MRNEAPVIVLADWAARVNAETRAFMGHSVAPEIPERQEARAYLAGLMTDEEAAACVAADLAAANAARDAAQSTDNDDAAAANTAGADDDYEGLFAAACRKADGSARRSSETTTERARRLLSDDVTLERAWHELNKPAGLAASTLMAAEFLVREGDAEQLQRWLAKHGADERKAIQKHLGGKHAAKPRTD